MLNSGSLLRELLLNDLLLDIGLLVGGLGHTDLTALARRRRGGDSLSGGLDSAHGLLHLTGDGGQRLHSSGLHADGSLLLHLSLPVLLLGVQKGKISEVALITEARFLHSGKGVNAVESSAVALKVVGTSNLQASPAVEGNLAEVSVTSGVLQGIVATVDDDGALSARAISTLLGANSSNLLLGLGLAEALLGVALSGIVAEGLAVASEHIAVSVNREGSEVIESVEVRDSVSGIGSLLESVVNSSLALADLVLLGAVERSGVGVSQEEVLLVQATNAGEVFSGSLDGALSLDAAGDLDSRVEVDVGLGLDGGKFLSASPVSSLGLSDSLEVIGSVDISRNIEELATVALGFVLVVEVNLHGSGRGDLTLAGVSVRLLLGMGLILLILRMTLLFMVSLTLGMFLMVLSPASGVGLSGQSSISTSCNLIFTLSFGRNNQAEEHRKSERLHLFKY
mmetsp:Transcript_20903/g.32358  ORF Transcript_20903/g.32358 Transcript_20903/m.32358 type:complete len:453 (-) Transcript_20903:28-1386(-)